MILKIWEALPRVHTDAMCLYVRGLRILGFWYSHWALSSVSHRSRDNCFVCTVEYEPAMKKKQNLPFVRIQTHLRDVMWCQPGTERHVLHQLTSMWNPKRVVLNQFQSINLQHSFENYLSPSFFSIGSSSTPAVLTRTMPCVSCY